MKRLLFSLTMLTLLAAPPVAAAGLHSIVVLPFENLSGDESASRETTFLVMGAFGSRGWIVANPQTVEELLRKERVRYLDYLDASARVRLLEATQTEAVITGTIYTYNEGRNPTVALSARMVSATGRLVWSNVVALSSADTEGLFGFGRASTRRDVAFAAVEKLAESLSANGKALRPTRGRGKGLFRSDPASVVAAVSADSGPKLICVLPFANDSRVPDASRVVGDLLALRLAAADGLSVVDSAALRTAALESGIASFRSIRPDQLERLSKSLGTPLFLHGTVYGYTETGNRKGYPEVSIELTLEDVRTGRVAWIAQHERRGIDYMGLLMRGAELTTVGLVDRVVSEMINTAEASLREGKRADRASVSLRSRNAPRTASTRDPQAKPGGTR